MVYGFGKVAFANFIGFITGFYFYSENVAVSLETIHFLGIVSLFVGLLTMLKVRGLGGVGGGFLTGFGLGVTFGDYFLP